MPCLKYKGRTFLEKSSTYETHQTRNRKTHLENQDRLSILAPTHNVFEIIIVHDRVGLAQKCRNHLTLQNLIVLIESLGILQR